MADATITFRDTVRRISPRWLQGFIGLRLLYAVAIHLDALADWVLFGVARRFPSAGSLTQADSLGVIGRERGIRRGALETAATYASRLRTWWDAHRRRGGPYALLEQLHAYYGTAPFAISLIYYSGRRFDMATDGTITRSLAVDAHWPPDADSDHWARWWLFYRWPTDIGTKIKWDDGTKWDDGHLWDGTTGLTRDVVADLRLVPTEWNAAHALGTIVLTTPSSTSINLADTSVLALVGVP